jgi:hypothetical protein
MAPILQIAVGVKAEAHNKKIIGFMIEMARNSCLAGLRLDQAISL